MPVFDFSAAPADENKTKSQCTYTTFRSNETKATPEKPVLILDKAKESGNIIPADIFPILKSRLHLSLRKRTVFSSRYPESGCTFYKSDQMAWRKSYQCPSFLDRIWKMDMLFTKSGRLLLAAATKFSAEDGFLQFMIERLFASNAPAEENEDDEEDEDGDEHEAYQYSEYY